MWNYMSYSYILDINSLSAIIFANIFSHSVDCPFVLWMVSFALQKFFSLTRSNLFIFAVVSFVWWARSKKILLCPTLCNPTDYITVHGILQARILESAAVPYSRGSSQPRDQTQVSCIVGWFFTSWATREDPISFAWGDRSKTILLQLHKGVFYYLFF